MTVGIRLFHSRNTLKNYVLVKPTENKCFLYGLNKDGSIEDNAKPLLTKTYTKYKIIRSGANPCDDSLKEYPHRYNVWKSTMPRNINNIPNGQYAGFSIKNRDGMTGDVVLVSGDINNKGQIASVSKLKFPITGYDSNGITNLARIYLKKVFNMFSNTKPNPNTYYVSEKQDKILTELDKEYNIPEFKVTDEIKESMDKLSKKHKIS